MPWLQRHRLSVLAGICFFWTALVLGLRYAPPNVPFFSTIWQSEQGFEDLLRREGRKTKTHDDFVFLGIDEASLGMTMVGRDEIEGNRAFQLMTERPFPWSREVWALLLDRLCQAGARVVMFDLIFDKPNDGDVAFHAALDRYRDKVVIGANVDYSGVREIGDNGVIVPPNASLISPPQLEDDRVGYVVFFPDPLDQKIRAARYTLTDRQLARQPPYPGEKQYESLSARTLAKLGQADAVPQDLKAHLIRFTSPDAYQPRPLWEVFHPALWRANYADGRFFKDKIVLVGSSAQIQHDFFDTPISPGTPGPVLHLHALAAALDHEFLHPMPLALGFATICLAGLLSWVVAVSMQRPILTIVTLLAISATYLGLARVLYDRWGILIMIVPTLTAFLLSGVFGLAFEYTLEQLEKVRTRRTLERYVSKNLVKEILDNPGGYYSSMLGSRKPVTVLFCDLIGFTTLVEHADPVVLVKQLNEYLSRMVTHVFDNGGTLDKFIGDAVMAVWGNVSSHGVAEDAKAAVRAALGMRASLRKLNAQWRAEGRTELKFGLGVNHGEAVVGNIGSYEPHERLDPTVVGDSVNLASRLEGLTRIYGVDILLGEATCDLVRDEFHLRTVARAQVKGKSEPVDICALIAARNDDVDVEFLKWLKAYEEGIRKFRERDFTQAKILFSRFLEFYPEDNLAKMYLDRALEYEQTPPDEAWNAVEIFKKK
jgi:adenylate cyclase